MTELEKLKAARDETQSEHAYWCAADAQNCGEPSYTWAKRWDAHKRALIAGLAFKAAAT
jgi:hypothetical protein